ncbi:lasso peptide biosynthesis B2 protein [Aurantiacibacter xanthus]|uniref:Lasso peptide biosynthesis B2 protein n=1 Tax=Aurantiacibacter xanthus TaxID=1784712 RepID=A0A3A1PGR4_9SPHN|nr:lasso peptide biosynthesis B2 protein [Aurantiacibacter xanthus]RIV92739.1 lasso peptide biosynthesis B2 protein [Aurantiacibacter xanthus]
MWRLAEHVSFCWVDGQAVFLDLSRDRYFALPRSVNCAFRQWSEQSDASTAMPETLIKNELVVPAGQDDPGNVQPCALPAPTEALALLDSRDRFRVTRAVEAALILAWMRRQVRRTPLRTLVAEASRRNAGGKQFASRVSVTDLAEEFARIRAWFPKHQTSCLPDSLALSMFLGRYGHAITLAFGVTVHPFGAHCWVQTGTTLLNDTLDHVVRYTPIRVICLAATPH